MKTYKIQIERAAEQDLYKIFSYISDTLLAPDAAKRIYLSIRQEIESLTFMAERYALIQEEPYRSAGIRKLLVENYLIFYGIDHDTNSVHILRVLYSRREWKHLL